VPKIDKPDPLAIALAGINKDFGAGTIRTLGDQPLVVGPVISTGSIALDEALGVGGLPRGRVIELYGPEGAGKTTFALTAAAQAQKDGLVVAFIDAEHALDPEWAALNGVDTDSMLVSQPDNGEQALSIASRVAHSGGAGLIIIDSVAALVPRAEIEGEIGDSHVGLQARMMSQALRMLTKDLSQTQTTCIFINQLREKVGIMFGSPETTSGGRALKFYASVRLDVRRIETLKDGADPVGTRVRIKVVKNKCAPPFKQAETDIIFASGLSREGELIDLGVARNVVTKAGAWYTYGGDQLGQGKEKSRQALRDDPARAAEIEAKVRAAKPEAKKPGMTVPPGQLIAGATLLDAPVSG
jgi:recombination protein RecA